MIVMVTSFVSSIEITEVELNPEGDDPGNEWIELYSSDEVNLTDHYLEDSDEDIFNFTDMNITEVFSGYFVLEFDKRFLDNEENTLFLKDPDGDIIFETIELNDTNDDNGKTWQFCSGDWLFLNDTKGEENTCEVEEEPEEETENENEEEQDNEETEDEENNETEEDDEEDIEEDEPEEVEENIPEIVRSIPLAENNNLNNEKIVLNAPVKEETLEEISEESIVVEEEKSFISKQEKMRLWVVYGFLALCVGLIVLLSLRRL